MIEAFPEEFRASRDRVCLSNAFWSNSNASEYLYPYSDRLLRMLMNTETRLLGRFDGNLDVCMMYMVSSVDPITSVNIDQRTLQRWLP